MNAKDERLAEFCRQHGYEGVLLRRRSNIAWLTDGADTHCDTASALAIAALLWTPRAKRIFTDNIEAPRLRAEEPLADWEIHAAPWWVAETPPWAAAAGGQPGVTAGGYATDWPDDCVAELRFSLTPAEVVRVRLLGRETADVVESVLKKEVRRGQTERQLGGAVAGALRARGIFGHVVLVGADERISQFRHPIPTARPIDKLVMVAVCGQRHGLIVSATRLVHFGALGKDLLRRHAAVCAVDNALHTVTRPGTRWCDALATGIAAYEQTGFGEEWQKHHQGGPMGYECRDFKATPTETRTVQASQVVGWNPSITGTKSEDTILTAGAANGAAHGPGYEVLTATGDWPLGPHGRPDILVR